MAQEPGNKKARESRSNEAINEFMPALRLRSKKDLYMCLALHMEGSPMCKDGEKFHKTGIVVCESDKVHKVVAMCCSTEKLHAVQQVILNTPITLHNCCIYLSRKPCSTCTKFLIQEKVSAVYYWPRHPELKDTNIVKDDLHETDHLFLRSSTISSVFVPLDRLDKSTISKLSERTRRFKCPDCKSSYEETREEDYKINCDLLNLPDSAETCRTKMEHALQHLNNLLNCTHPKGEHERGDIHALQLCYLLATRSDDPHKGIGCVLYDEKGFFFGAGYNGYPIGALYGNLPRSGRAIRNYPAKKSTLVHAEANALLFRSKKSIENTDVLYCSKLSCADCQKYMQFIGIKKIVTVEEPKQDSGPPAGSRRYGEGAEDQAKKMSKKRLKKSSRRKQRKASKAERPRSSQVPEDLKQLEKVRDKDETHPPAGTQEEDTAEVERGPFPEEAEGLIIVQLDFDYKLCNPSQDGANDQQDNKPIEPKSNLEEKTAYRPEKRDVCLFLAIHMENSPFCEEPEDTVGPFKFCKTGIVICEGDIFQRIIAMGCSSRSLHAVQRVLLKLSTSLRGCNVYLSRKPCLDCVKFLVQAQVHSILFWPHSEIEISELNGRKLSKFKYQSELINNILKESCTYDAMFMPLIDTETEETENAKISSMFDYATLDDKIFEAFNVPFLKEKKYQKTYKQEIKKAQKYFQMCTSNNARKLCQYNFVETRKCEEEDYIQHALQLCNLLAARSDVSNKVGSVIYKEKNIVATGYNGFPRGTMNNLFVSKNGDRLDDKIICAEANALIFRTEDNLHGAELITLTKPCPDCICLMKEKGLKRIIYPER